MDKNEFQQLIHKQIPIINAMGIDVLEFTPYKVRISAKLNPNINDKGTAFGGSISCLMTLCGWAMTFANIKESYPDANIVIQKNTIEYLVPIKKDFIAECTLENEDDKKNFLEMYSKHKKGKLDLKVTCYDKDVLLVKYQGRYVAFH
ncbi:YiiD C-terminal domain-containing protein [Clostridium felsineum]|uniref:Uncharacterized protein n=1 Tax=Clostridium felsineum TaxID=36839 RepID=A0A1S8L786_9CLOT|nr:YiiD C-terminal domain-containing protein [Clostridium felsineum]URZ07157.1 hypothetical protein CLROS_024900 [Clostridium felsineum]URZ12187.1 hypothetical protein CROST_029040 [Clostridium felsineum]